MSEYLEFRHGALCDSYEEQANRQGFTYGDKAKFVDEVGFGLIAAYIHGCITDAEYDRILRRFQKKILIDKSFLKRLDVEENDE